MKSSKCHRGLMLQSKYERPILSGRKIWEGRALREGGFAARVSSGDTVILTLTGHGKRGVTRTLSFRVAEIREFQSCLAMLRALSVSALLPDFVGTMPQACTLYEGLVGDGRYAAWRIDRKSLKLEERPVKPQRTKKPARRIHWTKQRGMVEKGVEQPKLDAKSEALLGQFGSSMVESGHRDDAAQQHKDRLRYSVRKLGVAGLRLLLRDGTIEDTRRKIRSWPQDQRDGRHLSCSFNWLVKFTLGKPLTPRYTIRSPNNPQKIAKLKRKAPEPQPPVTPNARDRNLRARTVGKKQV